MKIGPGDLIEVNVYDEADLQQTVRLNDLGDGTLSLIGSVHLAGLTTDQAEALIARKLKEGNYLLAPQVSVFIREYSTQGVSVLGEVKTPGVYGVAGGQSLLDVLAAAGGTTPLAGSEITIQRAGDASTLTVLFIERRPPVAFVQRAALSRRQGHHSARRSGVCSGRCWPARRVCHGE